MAVVKLTGKTQADLDTIAASEAQEQEVNEAKENVQSKQAVAFRLLLWLIKYVWPKLDDTERDEIRAIIPDEMEADMRDALEKLP